MQGVHFESETTAYEPFEREITGYPVVEGEGNSRRVARERSEEEEGPPQRVNPREPRATPSLRCFVKQHSLPIYLRFAFVTCLCVF